MRPMQKMPRVAQRMKRRDMTAMPMRVFEKIIA